MKTYGNARPMLIIRAKGPATKHGSIPLKDLLLLGKGIQTAIQRVARVLVGQGDSGRPGKPPKDVASSCLLEVIALNRGSFELALDLPRDQLPIAHLGMEAINKLLDGLEAIQEGNGPMPAGFDKGVLHSLKDIGADIGKGIDAVEIESRLQSVARRFALNKEVKSLIAKRIQGPVAALRSIEGRLLMADFGHAKEKCRIHPPAGQPIVCSFDESLEDTVYEHLRQYVRITGETQEDATTGRISSINITDIEPVIIENQEVGTFSAEEFWERKSLEQLAKEQEISPIADLDDIWGKGADLWEDNDDCWDQRNS